MDTEFIAQKVRTLSGERDILTDQAHGLRSSLSRSQSEVQALRQQVETLKQEVRALQSDRMVHVARVEAAKLDSAVISAVARKGGGPSVGTTQFQASVQSRQPLPPRQKVWEATRPDLSSSFLNAAAASMGPPPVTLDATEPPISPLASGPYSFSNNASIGRMVPLPPPTEGLREEGHRPIIRSWPSRSVTAEPTSLHVASDATPVPPHQRPPAHWTTDELISALQDTPLGAMRTPL